VTDLLVALLLFGGAGAAAEWVRNTCRRQLASVRVVRTPADRE
jgi:hypothetical protein